jgi:hypothetical protein
MAQHCLSCTAQQQYRRCGTWSQHVRGRRAQELSCQQHQPRRRQCGERETWATVQACITHSTVQCNASLSKEGTRCKPLTKARPENMLGKRGSAPLCPMVIAFPTRATAANKTHNAAYRPRSGLTTSFNHESRPGVGPETCPGPAFVMQNLARTQSNSISSALQGMSLHEVAFNRTQARDRCDALPRARLI